ncbi:hypothetical protein BLA29_009975 [Euroglyphus maynei]|uniref:Uncharacterized protein n=1 Tax=Euroglyphus maynei TaxID=6958 RepID=A0A1Y3AWG2_EURMA|nr:hypothetical protein BLA29_009975 [Euroglyphus maynei]
MYFNLLIIYECCDNGDVENKKWKENNRIHFKFKGWSGVSGKMQMEPKYRYCTHRTCKWMAFN